MSKHRFATFNFNGTETLVGVDQVNKPLLLMEQPLNH